MRALAAIALWLALAAGCSNSEPLQVGASELFRVRNAQFIRGPLPGKAAKPAGAAGSASAGSGASKLPRITARESKNNVVVQGQGGKAFSGRASTNSVAIAVALKGVSAGYWVAPTSVVDPQTGELTWSISADFDRDLKPGLYSLLFTVLDDEHVAGEQSALRLCVDSRVPDNLKVCNADQALPKAVISLSWDANVDLDLQVIGPDKRVIDAKMPASEAPDGGMLPADAGAIDRDSNAGCVIDGINTENLVWNQEQPSGVYQIYANLFDACKQPAVRFRAEVFTAVTDSKGSEHFKQQLAQGGELLDISANGGTARGLFVAEYKFE